jgi:IPT/TIG domain
VAPHPGAALVSLVLVVALGVGEKAGAETSVAASAPRKPRVTKVLPASGPSNNPPRVIIKGKRLRSVVKVKFGGNPAVRIRVLSGRRISVKPPAHRPGKVGDRWPR